MGIPIGSRHTSEVEGTFYRRFTCSSCDFVTLAAVRAKGEGEATSLLWLREDGAKSDAQNEAVRKAEEAADQMVAAGTCPSCQQHDASARSSLSTNAWVGGLGLGALTAVLIGFLCSRSDFAIPGGLLVGLVVALWHVSTRAWMWDDARVEVLGHAEVAVLLAKAGIDLDDVEDELPEARA